MNKNAIVTITVTLVSGATASFDVEESGRVYINGGSQYYELKEFVDGLQAMRAAGAVVKETYSDEIEAFRWFFTDTMWERIERAVLALKSNPDLVVDSQALRTPAEYLQIASAIS